MTEVIDRFTGKYRFLSNLYPAEVSLDGEKYPTVEHAYQAAKNTNTAYRRAVRESPTAGDARNLGRSASTMLPADWEDRRVHVMLDLLRQKFSDPILASLLLSTRDATLVEGNNWGDTFWGAVDGKGQNMLGVLLHIVRYEIKQCVAQRARRDIDTMWPERRS